jgi:hypothetical protein
MMISNKKVLYSKQLLHLVLALSLLQVDPVNYLEWGVPRIRSDIGPWQLEVAHTPFSEYVYMNRKTYVPLIEDLARFDRYHQSHDVQAYLLNFDNPTPFMASSENNTTPVNNNSTSESEVGTADTSNLLNLIHERLHDANVDDVFLQSDLFAQNESLVDQNLADLNDYEEQHLPSSINLSMPTKTEPIEPWEEFVGLHEDNSEARVNINGTRNPPPANLVRSAIIDWHDYLPFTNDSATVVEVKQEPKDESDNENEVFNAAAVDVVVKKEESVDDVNVEANNNEVEVTSNVELTPEVS